MQPRLHPSQGVWWTHNWVTLISKLIINSLTLAHPMSWTMRLLACTPPPRRCSTDRLRTWWQVSRVVEICHTTRCWIGLKCSFILSGSKSCVTYQFILCMSCLFNSQAFTTSPYNSRKLKSPSPATPSASPEPLLNRSPSDTWATTLTSTTTIPPSRESRTIFVCCLWSLECLLLKVSVHFVCAVC